MIKAVKFRLLNALFYFCRPLRANPLNVKFLTWQLRDLGFCRWNWNRVFPIIHPPIPLSAAGSAGPPCRGAGCTRSAGSTRGKGPTRTTRGKGPTIRPNCHQHYQPTGSTGMAWCTQSWRGTWSNRLPRNSRSNWTHWNSWTDRFIWSAGGEGRTGTCGGSGLPGRTWGERRQRGERETRGTLRDKL